MTSTTLTPISTRRRIAFYLPVILGAAGILAFFSLVAPIFPFGIQAWTDPDALSGHVVHSVADSTLFILPVIGLALQLHRAREKAAGVQMAILTMGMVTLVALFFVPEFAPVMGIFFLLTLAVGALHPARSEVFSLQGPLNGWAAALAGVALVASVGFIAEHLQLQNMAMAGDEHAEFGHWAITGAFALCVPLLALLGSFRPAGWRIPAFAAAALAGLYGLASILHPGQASTLGVTGGAVAILWAVAYLAVNIGRRRE